MELVFSLYLGFREQIQFAMIVQQMFFPRIWGWWEQRLIPSDKLDNPECVRGTVGQPYLLVLQVARWDRRSILGLFIMPYHKYRVETYSHLSPICVPRDFRPTGSCRHSS